VAMRQILSTLGASVNVDFVVRRLGNGVFSVTALPACLEHPHRWEKDRHMVTGVTERSNSALIVHSHEIAVW